MAERISEYRFTAYDLNWGQPFGSYTYDGLSISLLPSLYLAGDQANLNYGTSGGFPPVAASWNSGTTFEGASLLSLPRTIGEFDGSHYAVYNADIHIDPTASTVAFWVSSERDSLSRSTNSEVLLDVGVNGDNEIRFVLIGAGQLRVIYDGTTLTTLTETFAAGSTHFIAFSQKDGTWTLYVDGVAVDDGTGLAALTTATNSRLGMGTVVNSSGVESLPANHIRLQGRLEGVAIYPHKMDAATITRLHLSGRSGSYYSPLIDQDTIPQSVVAVERDFTEFVNSLAPSHWYRLHETSGTVAIDSGVDPVNGTYSGGLITVEGPLEPSNGTSRGKALYGDAGTKMTSGGRLFPSLTALGNTGGFTLSFYTVQGSNFSRRVDDMFSWWSIGPDPFGIIVQIKRNVVTFTKYNQFGRWSISVPDTYLPQRESGPVSRTDWALYTLTIDESGLMRVHVNDTLDVAPPVQSVGSGIRIGPTSTVFTIGHVAGGGDTNPEHFYSEMMLWPTTLTTDQIKSLYYVGRFGKNYARYIESDGAASDSILGYEVSEDPLPSLLNPRDITSYVTGNFSVEHAIDQVVSTGSLEVADSAAASIRSLVKANDVIVIERRDHSLDRRTVSDWQTVATMLVEGIPQDSSAADGTRSRSLILKSTTKALSFDAGIEADVEPDVFTLRKATCSLIQATSEAYVFGVERPEEPGTYFYNYKPYPTPRLRVSAFQNLSKHASDPPESWGPGELPSEVIVKSAQSAIQVVVGQGQVRIDADYYGDALAAGVGLGDPNHTVGGVKIDIDRYCVPEDEFESRIIAHGLVDGKWCVQISNPLERPVARTIFVQSGNTRSPIYKLYPLYEPGKTSTWLNFTNVTQTGSDIAWGDTTGVPTNPAFSGDGQPDKALSRDNLSAYTVEATSSSFTNYLTFDGLDVNIEETRVIRGIEVRVRRWAYVPYGTGFAYSPWGQSYCNDNVMQLTIDGTAVGDNKAITGRTLTATDFRYDAPLIEDVIFGGDNDLWGLSDVSAASLQGLGVRIRAAFGIVPNARAAIESVQIRFYTEPKKGSEEWHQVADWNDAPINPAYENLDVNTLITVGNSNRVEKVLMLLGLLGGFQTADPNRPLYLDITNLPSAYNLVVPPFRTRYDDRTTISELMAESLKYAFPNYLMRPTRTGGLEIRQFIQGASPDYVLTTVQESSADSSDTNIYTKVRVEGEGGDSVNLCSVAAVRAYKHTNWATTGSTPTGTGEQSAAGRSYGETDSDQLAMNTILKQMFDSSQRTPQLSGGGWTIYNNLGVIWAMSGPKVEPYSMEDEDLFAIDLGRNVSAGKEYLVSALQFTSWNTYKDESDSTIPLQISVYYMTENDYARVMGYFPSDFPDQADADKAVSYFPPADSWAWQVLIDQAQLQADQQTTFEASEFETARETKMRFIKVRVHQAHYYDGKGVKDDRRARISLSDMKVWTSRKIVATATLGKTDPFSLGTHKEALGRLRLRTISYGFNPLVQDYETGRTVAVQQLTELVQEFLPRSVITGDFGPTAGDVVRFTDYRTQVVVDMLTRAAVETNTGTSLVGVDYRLTSENYR